MKIKTILLLGWLLLLTGCATHPLKAPCDAYANFCGKKIKINTTHEI